MASFKTVNADTTSASSCKLSGESPRYPFLESEDTLESILEHAVLPVGVVTWYDVNDTSKEDSKLSRRAGDFSCVFAAITNASHIDVLRYIENIAQIKW